MTFSEAGAYAFRVTVTDNGGLSTVSSPLNVNVVETVHSLTLNPASLTLAINGQKQFIATAYDQFGVQMPTPTVSWSTTVSGGRINSSGLFQAPGGNASGNVTATVSTANGPVSQSASVVVSPQPPQIIGPTATLATPETANLAVSGHDDYGDSTIDRKSVV